MDTTGARNRVAAVLAVLVTIEFTAVFAFLAFGKVDAANKDFFNIALIALIGLIQTAFGYYLGSSVGSARKTELIGTAPPEDSSSAPSPRADAGFICLPLLLSLGLLCLALVGCASTFNSGSGDTLVKAGKSLLAAKETITAAARSTDALCQAGTLDAAKCLQAKGAYEQSKPAYDAAVDAYLMLSAGGGDPAALSAAILRVQGIAQNILLITGGVN